MGKLFIIVGVLSVIIGILMIFKVPIPLGKLPGDISIQGKNFQFYFPIVSCLVVSAIISFLFYLFSNK